MAKVHLSHDFLETRYIDDLFKQNLEELISYGISAGASFVEIFIENIDSVGLLAEQDTVTSVNPSIGKGVGIRAFLGQRDGFVSTNDLSEQGLKFALDQALGMLGLETNSQTKKPFEGLNELNNFGKSKTRFLTECPTLKESTNSELEKRFYVFANCLAFSNFLHLLLPIDNLNIQTVYRIGISSILDQQDV